MPPMNQRAWWTSAVALVAAVAIGGMAAACGTSSQKGYADNGAGDSGLGTGTDSSADGASSTGPPGSGGDAANIFGSQDGGPLRGTLTIVPAAPVVSVTIDATGLHVMPVTFTAQDSGQTVPATWILDRGDLGTIGTTTGVFTASGQGAGVGNVTASSGGLTASTTVTVQIVATENGAPTDAGVPEAGVGGNGGVGGTPLGGPVNPGVTTLLQGAASPDAGLSSGSLTWMYPYDQTVWPQGLLPPLLQWTNPPKPASAVYIHLTEANYEFQGFYSGTNLVNQPIDPTAWTVATNSNSGGPLRVEVSLTDGTNVYGPIAETWYVAGGQLKGVVYYSSYYTQLANAVYEAEPAAILAIRSGSTDPTLAIPGAQNKCIICHEVSADGAAMFASDADGGSPDYSQSDSFELTTGSGTPTQTYMGRAPDGTTNDRKFLWSGAWRDGSFALQSSQLAANQMTDESYGDNSPGGTDVDSRLFERTTGNAIPAPGFDGQIKDAVTPSFSPDGTKVAFNFLAAQPNASTGLAAGGGHTIDLMDFMCGAPLNAGNPPSPTAGPACGAPSFSGLRRLYTNMDQANGWPAWPAWLPDSSAVVFHNTVLVAPGTSPVATWHGNQAELWLVDATASPTSPAPQAIPLRALNGVLPSGAGSYLPTNAMHPNDAVLNYEPTVSPIPSGGYFWVVFTSRRMYGNVATGDPEDIGDGTSPVTKKLWVAAIDLKRTPGQDSSHPAFYLPAQELDAPNMRGYWVPAPCLPDGSSCTTGDECCGGYCEQGGSSAALICTHAAPMCSQQYEKCTTTADCCNSAQGYTCINSLCTMPPVQ